MGLTDQVKYPDTGKPRNDLPQLITRLVPYTSQTPTPHEPSIHEPLLSTHLSPAHIPSAPTLIVPYVGVSPLTSQIFEPGPEMVGKRSRKVAVSGLEKKRRVYFVASCMGVRLSGDYAGYSWWVNGSFWYLTTLLGGLDGREVYVIWVVLQHQRIVRSTFHIMRGTALLSSLQGCIGRRERCRDRVE